MMTDLFWLWTILTAECAIVAEVMFYREKHWQKRIRQLDTTIMFADMDRIMEHSSRKEKTRIIYENMARRCSLQKMVWFLLGILCMTGMFASSIL